MTVSDAAVSSPLFVSGVIRSHRSAEQACVVDEPLHESDLNDGQRMPFDLSLPRTLGVASWEACKDVDP